MKVHYSVPPTLGINRSVVTIGTFDGVHTGHRKIIEQLLKVAEEIGGETVLITFHPHPREVIQPAQSPVPLLNTIREKAALLEKLGLDHLVVIPFTEAFARMEATAYVETFLVGQFHPHTIIIGYDHRFGADRKGDYQLLEKYKEKHVFDLKEIPMQVANDVNVSSTRIRKALQEGNVEEASALLGYPYSFEGTVVKGNQLGKTMGYPTANLQLEDPKKLLPRRGVYAVYVSINQDGSLFPKEGENLYKGMMNLGVRPTVGGDRLVTEVHLIGYEGDLYHRTIRVFLQQHLRDEKKFENLEALREQLDRDKASAVEMLKKQPLLFF